MTLTLGELVAECERSLASAGLHFGHGTDNPFDEAAWLVAHVAGIDLAQVEDLPWDDAVEAHAAEAAWRLVEERIASGKPLAYLIREAWFAGERFYIDERAIVPRSHLGEWIAERFDPWLDPTRVRRILDLATGSGCIAVALALNFPAARVVATDLSADALEVARINVERHRVGARVSLRQGNLYEPVAGETFDLIVSNPPYVSDDIMAELPEEYRHEPAMAFAGGAQGLDLVYPILDQAAAHLAPGGILVVEVGSASAALEKVRPEVPLTWLATSSEDPVVFLVRREELLAAKGGA